MRARLLKPGFFETEDIAKLDPMARLLFAGLWCLADREGRLEDRPRLTSSQIFPYEDNLTVQQVEVWLEDLARIQSDGKPFIIRYAACGKRYIQVVGFAKHQHVHPREIKSVIPAPEKPGKPKDTSKEAPKASLGLDHSREITGLSPSVPYCTSEPSVPYCTSEPSVAAAVSAVEEPLASEPPKLLLLDGNGKPPDLNANPKADIEAVEAAMRHHSEAAVGDHLAGLALQLYGRSWVEAWSLRREATHSEKLKHGGAVLRCLARDFSAAGAEDVKWRPVLVEQERRCAAEMAEQTAQFAKEGEDVH